MVIKPSPTRKFICWQIVLQRILGCSRNTEHCSGLLNFAVILNDLWVWAHFYGLSSLAADIHRSLWVRISGKKGLQPSSLTLKFGDSRNGKNHLHTTVLMREIPSSFRSFLHVRGLEKVGLDSTNRGSLVRKPVFVHDNKCIFFSR